MPNAHCIRGDLLLPPYFFLPKPETVKKKMVDNPPVRTSTTLLHCLPPSPLEKDKNVCGPSVHPLLPPPETMPPSWKWRIPYFHLQQLCRWFRITTIFYCLLLLWPVCILGVLWPF